MFSINKFEIVFNRLDVSFRNPLLQTCDEKVTFRKAVFGRVLGSFPGILFPRNLKPGLPRPGRGSFPHRLLKGGVARVQVYQPDLFLGSDTFHAFFILLPVMKKICHY